MSRVALGINQARRFSSPFKQVYSEAVSLAGGRRAAVLGVSLFFVGLVDISPHLAPDMAPVLSLPVALLFACLLARPTTQWPWLIFAATLGRMLSAPSGLAIGAAMPASAMSGEHHAVLTDGLMTVEAATLAFLVRYYVYASLKWDPPTKTAFAAALAFIVPMGFAFIWHVVQHDLST